MSVHFWGEDPRGSWTLSVTDNAHNNRQHHRYKTRFGDTEDATQKLQEEMNLYQIFCVSAAGTFTTHSTYR